MRRFLPLNPDAALLVLRVVLGIIMIYHGWPKLTNLGGTIEGFTGMGIPLPALAAIFATVAEFGGGFLILIGVLTDIAGLLVAIDMLGAIIFVHAKNGFWVDRTEASSGRWRCWRWRSRSRWRGRGGSRWAEA